MPSIRVGTITFDWYPFDPLSTPSCRGSNRCWIQVDVICLRRPGEKRYEVYNGVHIYRMPMGRGFGRSLPLTLLAGAGFFC